MCTVGSIKYAPPPVIGIFPRGCVILGVAFHDGFAFVLTALRGGFNFFAPHVTAI